MPSLLEYVSYTCNFMGILAGPLCSYKDYIAFIEGRASHVAQPSENGKDEQHGKADPSPNVRACASSEALRSLASVCPVF
jgi:lysophospholipid acyltransferase 1/2